METFARWESESRYYAARVSQDLLGAWIVEAAWGGLYNRLGNSGQEIVESHEAGLERIAEIDRTRTKHKYRLVQRKTEA